jgi:hypothetical protein
MPQLPNPSSKNLATFRIIETLLLWEGVARNERVRELLGLHYVSISRLLSQYEALNSEGLTYSTATRGYIAGPAFKPLYTDGRVEEYLALLAKMPNEGRNVVRTHMDFGGVNYRAYALLHRACREGIAVTAEHCSMRHPTPTSKRFFPLSLVEAGRRWHVRAYVSQADGSGVFRDLALTRLRSIKLTNDVRPETASLEQDLAWSTLLDVRIVAHPLLSLEQRQVVRREYFNGTVARRVSIRAALLNYTLQDLRVATDAAQHRPPDYQLMVDNLAAIKEWLLPTSQ